MVAARGDDRPAISGSWRGGRVRPCARRAQGGPAGSQEFERDGKGERDQGARRRQLEEPVHGCRCLERRPSRSGSTALRRLALDGHVLRMW